MACQQLAGRKTGSIAPSWPWALARLHMHAVGVCLPSQFVNCNNNGLLTFSQQGANTGSCTRVTSSVTGPSVFPGELGNASPPAHCPLCPTPQRARRWCLCRDHLVGETFRLERLEGGPREPQCGAACRSSRLRATMVHSRWLPLVALAASLALVAGHQETDESSPRWWGPYPAIWQHCPTVATWGNATATAADCMVEAARLGANAVNYNTDRWRKGDACQLRNCSPPSLPEWHV